MPCTVVNRQIGLVQSNDFPIGNLATIRGRRYTLERKCIDHTIDNRGVIAAVKHLRTIIGRCAHRCGVGTVLTVEAADQVAARPVERIVTLMVCNSITALRIVPVVAVYVTGIGTASQIECIIAKTKNCIARDKTGAVNDDITSNRVRCYRITRDTTVTDGDTGRC